MPTDITLHFCQRRQAKSVLLWRRDFILTLYSNGLSAIKDAAIECEASFNVSFAGWNVLLQSMLESQTSEVTVKTRYTFSQFFSKQFLKKNFTTHFIERYTPPNCYFERLVLKEDCRSRVKESLELVFSHNTDPHFSVKLILRPRFYLAASIPDTREEMCKRACEFTESYPDFLNLTAADCTRKRWKQYTFPYPDTKTNRQTFFNEWQHIYRGIFKAVTEANNFKKSY